MGNAEWTDDDQAVADFVADLACEISADEEVVGDVIGTLIERGLFDANIARASLTAKYERPILSKQPVADGDTDV